MQLPQSKFKDNVFGAQKEMSFEIDDDNSIIFDILRDKMYSDKIGSLCREVVSNSRDANREAGRGDVPVEIHIMQPDKIQSISDMSIVFKDYGVGITPDRMSDVFIKYAASTKRSTDSQTGGFGLGAKTPFAYTDTFTVVTICDVDGKRMKFTYTAMIDSSRKGKTILFDQQQSTKKTGTQIIVPIKTQDISEFESKCIHSTMLWDIKPKLVNFTTEYPEVRVIEDNDDFSIITSLRLNAEKYYLDIDGIGYSVNKDQCGIRDSGLKDNYTIVLKFDVGQLSISANREAVQYDESTVEKINEKVQKVKQFLIEQLNEKLSKSKTYLQACLNYQSIIKSTNQHDKDSMTNILNNAVSDGIYESSRGILFCENQKLTSGAKWNGKQLKKRIVLKHHDVVYVRKPLGDSNVEYTPTSNIINQLWLDTPIFYMDCRKNIRRNLTIWDKYKEQFLLIIPHNTNKSTQQQVIDECIELGFEYQLDIHMYSDIDKAKNNPIQSSRYVKGKTVTVKHRVFRRNHWTSEQVEFHRENKMLWDQASNTALNKQYCYVIVDSLTNLGSGDRVLYRPMSHKIPYDKIDLINIIDQSVKVMCINQTTYNRYISKTSIKSIQHHLKTKLHSCDGLVKKYINHRVTQMTNNTFPQTVIQHFKYLLPKVVVAAIDQCDQVTQKNFPPNFTEIVDVKFDFTSLQNKLNKIEQKYPMLLPYIKVKFDRYTARDLSDQERQKRLDIIKKYIQSVG